MSDYTILTPGPVPLSEGVRAELHKQVLHHRTPEFESILSRCFDRLKQIFATDGHVFILTSTGSGGMEAALVNTLSPGQKALCLVSGKFGQRWSNMAKSFGIEVTDLEIPWGQSVDIEELREACEKESFDAVLSQACETSTGVLHPVEKFRSAIGEKPLLLIDGITAVGATPISMTDAKIDVLVAGSQKAFALPTGMSFVGFSGRALEKLETAQCPRFYFDLRPEFQANQKSQTHFSSATTLIQALDIALNQVLIKGLEKHLEDIHQLATNTRSAVKLLGLKVFAASPSASLTAIDTDEIDSNSLRSDLEKNHKITIMGGQDHLKGKILRIGHMGAIDNSMMLHLWRALYSELLKRDAQRFEKVDFTKIEELFR